MNYQEAKAKKDALWERADQAGKVLNQFPKGPMGLTPDDVKFSPEFQAAKQAFDIAFKEMRDFNAYFNKVFKKEFAIERRTRLRNLLESCKSSLT